MIGSAAGFVVIVATAVVLVGRWRCRADRYVDAAGAGATLPGPDSRRGAVDVEVAGERVGAIVYDAVSTPVAEALANAVKHADASKLAVRMERAHGVLTIEVGDDGVGGAGIERGGGLRGVADRVEALGGHLRVDSRFGHGTHLVAELPCGS